MIMYNRRMFLKSSSVFLALPFFQSHRALAQVTGRPIKTCFLIFPMGTHIDQNNNAAGEGGKGWMVPDVVNGQLDFSRRVALQPLTPFKSELIFPLRVCVRDANGSGAHEGGTGQFLTVAGFNNSDNPQYPVGRDRNLRSIDQDIAATLKLNRLTLEHLNMYNVDVHNMKVVSGGEVNSMHGKFHSWIGRDAQGALDLKAADQQVEYNPYTIFNKLFPNNMQTTNQADLKNRRKVSILDSVVRDIATLRGEVNAEDKMQLDLFTSSVRSLEVSLTNTTSPVCSLSGSNPFPSSVGDTLTVSKFRTYTQQMMDLIALAMACDRSRVITYSIDGGDIYGTRNFKLAFPGASYWLSIHDASHIDGTFGGISDPNIRNNLWQEYRAYNQLYVEMFAYLLQKLKNNNSLDSSILAFGSALTMLRTSTSASNHNTHDLPLILAGKANGQVTPGKVIDLGQNIRLGTVWRKIHQLATGTDIDLGPSLAHYYPAPGGEVFQRSDSFNLPL